MVFTPLCNRSTWHLIEVPGTYLQTCLDDRTPACSPFYMDKQKKCLMFEFKSLVTDFTQDHKGVTRPHSIKLQCRERRHQQAPCGLLVLTP